MSDQVWKDTALWRKSHQWSLDQASKMEAANRLKVYCRMCGSFVTLKDPYTLRGINDHRRCVSCGDTGPHDCYEIGTSPLDKETMT